MSWRPPTDSAATAGRTVAQWLADGHDVAPDEGCAVLQLDALERSGFGRYAGRFRGCLRDDDEPPLQLIEAIYAALFDRVTLEDDDHMAGGFSLSSGQGLSSGHHATRPQPGNRRDNGAAHRRGHDDPQARHPLHRPPRAVIPLGAGLTDGRMEASGPLHGDA